MGIRSTGKASAVPGREFERDTGRDVGRDDDREGDRDTGFESDLDRVDGLEEFRLCDIFLRAIEVQFL